MSFKKEWRVIFLVLWFLALVAGARFHFNLDYVAYIGFSLMLALFAFPKACKYDGVIFASESEDKIRWELSLSEDPDMLSKKKEVTFKIINSPDENFAG